MADRDDGVLKSLAPLGVVLHIGAGLGAEVPAYLAADARQIVLADPDPDCKQSLLELSARHALISFVPVAVTGDIRSGEGDSGLLHRFGFAGLNSLRSPSKTLRELFPGGVLLEPVSVMQCPITELAADLKLDLPGNNVLVLEAPGMALELLQALQAAGYLELFHLIRISEGRQPLYDGAAALADIRAFLASVGFDQSMRETGTDPDWPVLEVAANANLTTRVPLRRYQQLEKKLEARTSDCEELQVRLQVARTRVQELGTECETLTSSLTEAENLAGDLAGRVTQLQAELEQQSQNLAKEEAAREQQAQDAQKQLQQAQQELRKVQEQVASEEKRHYEAELRDARETAETFRSEAQVAQQNLSVALRMQSLRETDLRELQLRYGDLLKRKNEQDELLHRLSTSLGCLMEEAGHGKTTLAARRGTSRSRRGAVSGTAQKTERK